MNSYIEIAYKVAERSTHPQHSMGAVVVRGGAILSAAHNMHKRHTCCERRALRKLKCARGAIIIVVRRNGTGMSKPCLYCQRAIVAAGIKKVIYFDVNGQMVVNKPEELN